MARDPTNGVVALALTRGLISVADLTSMPPRQLIERIDGAGIEAELLDQWRERRANVERIVGEIRSVDLHSYLTGLESLLGMHLSSRGLK